MESEKKRLLELEDKLKDYKEIKNKQYYNNNKDMNKLLDYLKE